MFDVPKLVLGSLLLTSVAGFALATPPDCDVTRADPFDVVDTLTIACSFYCIDGAEIHAYAEGILGGVIADCPGNDTACYVDPIAMRCEGSTEGYDEGPGRCRLSGDADAIWYFRCWNA